MSSRMSSDGRIPIVIETAADAALAPGDCRLALPQDSPAAALHGAACACCRPRGAVEQALALLYLHQMRGARDICRRVVVSAGEAEAVRRAVEADVLAGARFRFAGAIANCPAA